VEQTQRDDASEARRGGRTRAFLGRCWSNPAYRFVVLFLLYLAIEATFYPLLKKRFMFLVEAAITGTAKIEYWFFRIFTEDVSISNRMVSYGNFPVTIIEECTGIFEIIIFAAAVLAFPTTWRKKLAGFAFGIPAIYVFNVIRIALLMVVGRYYRESFDFMHLYFWQATMIAMITTVWLIWIAKVVRDDKAALATPR
jgi:archaeosortase B (VPXXXP-CTERM-specific)